MLMFIEVVFFPLPFFLAAGRAAAWSYGVKPPLGICPYYKEFYISLLLKKNTLLFC